MLPRELSQTIVVGTSNAGKLAELRSFSQRLGFSVMGPNDSLLGCAGPAPRVPEVALSYEGNARLKGSAYAKWSGRPCLTDDTGIEIQMLGGLPGIHTARWGLARVVDALGAHRVVAARFVCSMVYTEPSGRFVCANRAVVGELRYLADEENNHPLAFSKFFYPSGSENSLSVVIKEHYEYSHRFRALESLVRALS